MNTALTASDISNARLPAAYEAAKQALANCASVDECMDWADKAAALASYAKQADDNTLFAHAKRIQGRAISRAGALLKQIDGRPHNAEKQTMGDHGLLSQRALAARAGMSEHQQLQAVRVANIPADVLDQLLDDSETPPTITALANMGRTPRPEPERPPGFHEAIHTLGAMRRFAEKCREHEPVLVAGGVESFEVAEARALVSELDAWLDVFVVNLKGPMQ